MVKQGCREDPRNENFPQECGQGDKKEAPIYIFSIHTWYDMPILHRPPFVPILRQDEHGNKIEEYGKNEHAAETEVYGNEP